MTWSLGISLYFVIWWIALFGVLPFGVKSQAEANDVSQGTEPGAPLTPMLVRKALQTSVVASVVFGLVWAAMWWFDV